MKHKSITGWVLIACALVVAVLCVPSWAQASHKNDFATNTASVVPAGNAAAQGVAAHPAFIIGADDVLNISVWRETELTRSVTVRPDGRISMALIGELPAGGKTPEQLERDITARLRPFVTDPVVTVIVQEIRSRRFSVLGNVSHPGSFALTNATTVLDGIAQAGGFRDFAKQRDIFILRQNANGSLARLPFNYKAVVKGQHSEQNVELQPRDTIVVP